jgi:hypothetical protein
MNVSFSERSTKYHNERQKTAVINVPAKGPIELALSDTQRCARSLDSAKRTVKNVAGDAIDDAEVEQAGAALHAHCRRMIGIQEDPESSRR